jgi:teichoic acid transport system permease protein
MKFNPIYDFIELARGALVNGYQMTPFLWWACICWSIGLLILGLVFFWKVEERYGRED